MARSIVTSIHGRRIGLAHNGDLILNTPAGYQKVIPVGALTVPATAATLTADAELHAGRTVLLDRAAGIAVTLPAATGSQDEYAFLVVTDIASNTTTIKAANASDTFIGWASAADTTGGNGWQEAAGGTDDTLTMNGSTKGGDAGSYVVVKDIAANKWLVRAFLVGSGTFDAVFSATVS